MYEVSAVPTPRDGGHLCDARRVLASGGEVELHCVACGRWFVGEDAFHGHGKPKPIDSANAHANA